MSGPYGDNSITSPLTMYREGGSKSFGGEYYDDSHHCGGKRGGKPTAAFLQLLHQQEQHAHSCPIYNINQVWADSSRRVITWARADSITIMFVQPGTEYKLYKVLGAHQERDFVLTHSTGQGKKDDKPCKIMPARTCQMCDKGYSTVFSLEYMVEKNMYQVSFQQCHVCANVNLQIGEVNKMDRKRMCTKAIYVD